MGLGRYLTRRGLLPPVDLSPPPDLMTLLAQAPQVGDDATAQQQIAATRRQKRNAAASAPGTRNGTLLTGPAGVTAPASTAPKTLLGG